ncbi:MAG: glycerophosphodiester phosphodiesterase [Candidatus Saliniplasma sp.]
MDCKIIAHRGASALVEFDNSIGSFRKAIEVGADMVEFDIRKTQEGKLVAFHDTSIKGKKISRLTYPELLDISESRGFKVPLVEDVIHVCKGKVGLDIELKEEGYETEVVDLVKSHLEPDQFFMKSFSDRTVKTIKGYDPEIQAGLLLGLEKPENKIRTRLSELFPGGRLKRCRADFVSPNHHLLTLFFLKRMASMDRDVYVWTVNEVELMKKLFRRGVKGMITDRPDLAVKVRERLDKTK